MSNSPFALEIKNLTLIYESQNASKVVLDGVNLRVKRGEFVAVVGPSGCGKTTLLNLIAGFIHPTSGEVHVNGALVERPNRNIGVVFQDYTLFPWLAAQDNVAYGMELEGIHFLMKWLRPFHFRRKRREYREKARRYLSEVGLEDAVDKKPHQLSGGMKQRVAIAQEIIRSPSILLMDEPFGALDPQTREVLQVLILKIHEREKNTIFFVTHDLEEAVYVAGRVIVLSQYNHDSKGARIVKDVPVPVFRSTDAKRTGDFGNLIQEIRKAGFTPEQRAVIETFDQAYTGEGEDHAQE